MSLLSTICLEAIFYKLFVIVFRIFSKISFSLSIIEAVQRVVEIPVVSWEA